MSIDMVKARADARATAIKESVKAALALPECDSLPWALVAMIEVAGERSEVRASGTVSAEVHSQGVGPAYPARDALLVAWFRCAALRKMTTELLSRDPAAITKEADRIRDDHKADAAEFAAAIAAGVQKTEAPRRRVDVSINR